METHSHPDDLDLQNYWLVLKRRWPIALGIFLTSVALSAFAISLQRATYEAEGKILFQANRTNSLTGVDGKFRDLESIRREANPLSTQAVILQSRPILQAVIEKLNLRDDTGKLVDPKSLIIKVEPVAGTDVLNVSFISDKPKEAAAIVNQLMRSYVDNNIKNNRSEALAARKFIEAQLPRAKGELDKTTEDLRRFKEQNQVINLQEESNETVKTIAELDKQLNEAQAQLAEVTSQHQELRSQVKIPSEKAVDVASLSLIPGVQEVLGELQKVQTKLATEKSRYNSTHPSVINLEEQEKALASLLQQRVSESAGANVEISPNSLQLGGLKEQLVGESVRLQAQRLGLANKVQTLANLHQLYKRRANVLPNLEKKQGDLERRLGVAQESYKNLLTRLQEVRVAENQNVGSARIVQEAVVPNQPVSSKLTLYLAAGGIFVGLMLGIAAAFLIDIIDRSIKTTKEAQNIFGYTLLGLIPKFSTNNAAIEQMSIEGASPRVIVGTLPRSVIHEAYQMLEANLNFISHKRVRTLVVTSSVAGEGKSEVSANLAAVIAQTGKRVLIIDADMRNPSQHHLWGVMNLTGLSNAIVGQNQIRRCIQSVTRNLSVLTAGVIPPNPLVLIGSESMNALIHSLSESYDYIIFDTPPLAGTADAAVLGKMVDGVLVVVRPGVGDTASALAAKSLLLRSEANVLGIIANGVNVKYEPDNYFYYNSNRTEVTSEQLVAQNTTASRK
ncbi:GumC family protein [Calothrix sp. UHCC 0171]|uniref:GumC family protein n=1 Tax=Calothrix sp. UHCC 0171 TaxID=3110245 RepID=UPI002B1F88FE|nr:polysaccharide biosynthesis tyrosine autokinase [Calothrix sp. UHCC 0171]MEA5573931.1 polysaccharide biosynthesis tyrosine autokinase [Calothrix sp. UHCC 0171]